MATELFSLAHILKTLFALISVCAAAVLFITYVLPRFKKVNSLSTEQIGLKVVSKRNVDNDNAIVLMEDCSGTRFLFSSSSNAGLRLLGNVDSDGRFLPLEASKS